MIRLKKWGNSHGVILPKSILKEANIDSDNVTFEVSVTPTNKIVLKEKKETLKDLFKDFDYKKYWADWEAEHPGQSKEIDWGKPVGREIF